ncbi:MAG: OmpA family protein [Methylococcales bacterium]|nr:OmpA family protein [Methylococcales bacterium]
MKTNNKTVIASIIAGALFSTTAAWSQGVKMYDKPPSAAEMGSILFPKGNSSSGNLPLSKGSQGGIGTRSISIGAPAAKPPSVDQMVQSSSAAIGLPIEFAYNSTDILPKSMGFLEEVGKMLTMPEYAQERLVVEGHTDASGSETYNQYLSEKRAQAVKQYLVNRFNIAPGRLMANGMGESQLLPGVSPTAAVNRRVQFYRAP